MKKLINLSPSPAVKWLLGLLPFVLIVVIYVAASDARLAENPSDKLLPSFTSMQEAMSRMAFEPSKRSGDYVFWTDTLSSLRRLSIGVGIAAVAGLVIGIATGALPLVNAALSPLLTVVSLIPCLALLPVLFIVLGLGEVSKISLITIGITPFIARDIQRRAREIPVEQLIKAQTLGANTAQIISRVLLPQLLPKLINSVRLSLGTGWLFLIAAEAIASTDGLGYRIFLVRRYLSMEVILPYVAWITILAFLFDLLLRKLGSRLFPWESAE
ncbi:ABC transporter permease [Granulosicoccus sp. 3-233]|uniref:ABC transporter permease n=1 Tax=Granulosicoccus sp. 3-233 TaxID=3417969 RepID=UPI003D35347C